MWPTLEEVHSLPDDSERRTVTVVRADERDRVREPVRWTTLRSSSALIFGISDIFG